MKLLKIDDKLGFYLCDGGTYLPVDRMTKEGLLYLVDQVLKYDKECEMDEYNQEELPNQAHQIIYQSVYTKISELAARRDEFIDQSERMYLEEYERYKADVPQKCAESDVLSDVD